MEFMIADPTYDHPDRDRDIFLSELRMEAESLSPEIALSDTDAGHAADWPMILVVISGLFFLGKPINENLDAWLDLGRKLSGFLKRVREKWAAARFDETGCVLLAIDHLSKSQTSIRTIEVIGTIPAHFQVFPMRRSETLSHHPDALYVIALRVNDEKVHVVGVKSKGNIEFEHSFNVSYLEF